MHALPETSSPPWNLHRQDDHRSIDTHAAFLVRFRYRWTRKIAFVLVRIAGAVIVRERPGTADGFVFLGLEDETGVMNAILTPAIFDRYKQQVVGEAFLLIHGPLQNLDALSDLGYEFPSYPVPEGQTMMSYLRKLADEGGRRRYRPYHQRARMQIERELALIENSTCPAIS